MRKLYVNGFLFNDSGSFMAMIKKVHFPPNVDWSLNPYNGIGGKVEVGERFIDAMVREFKEETGVSTNKEDWGHFATVTSPDWVVYYYRAFNTQYLRAVRTMTDEMVVCRPSLAFMDTVPHLSFLIPYALWRTAAAPATFEEVADVRA